jgi:hypothetical protein
LFLPAQDVPRSRLRLWCAPPKLFSFEIGGLGRRGFEGGVFSCPRFVPTVRFLRRRLLLPALSRLCSIWHTWRSFWTARFRRRSLLLPAICPDDAVSKEASSPARTPLASLLRPKSLRRVLDTVKCARAATPTEHLHSVSFAIRQRTVRMPAESPQRFAPVRPRTTSRLDALRCPLDSFHASSGVSPPLLHG